MSVNLKVWLEAARPKTLPAAVVPVMVGTALAATHHSPDYPRAAICLAFALLVQIGTNFANDYFDFVQGADTAARVGPRRAVAAGLVTPRQMLVATWLILGVAFAVGLLLVHEVGWALLPIGIISIICAIAYTGGPFPLGYNGLGDLFVFVFFGLVAVCATFYVQVGSVTSDAIACATAIGVLAANILVANNYRDIETDAVAGKKTLVVRFGRKFALWQYGLSNLGALLAPLLLMVCFHYRWPVLLPLLLAPLALSLTRCLAGSQSSSERIALLGATARLLAAYGVLLSLGLVLG